MSDLSSEKLEKLTAKTSDIAVDLEKSFYKYIIAGSAGAIGIILAFYRDTFGGDSQSTFDVPLWLFTTSLILSTLHIAVAAFLAGLNTKALAELTLEAKVFEMKTFNMQNAHFTAGQTERNNAFLEKVDKVSIKAKRRTIVYLGFASIGALVFSSALILSIYKVTTL